VFLLYNTGMSTEETKELKPLSKKNQLILDKYILCGIQYQAYQAGHPTASDEVARTMSSRLFADVNFKAHLQKRYDEVHMSANEALKLRSDIARGDITELMTPLGNIDIDLIRESGKGRLIKKIKQRTITKIGKTDKNEDTEIHETEIELYSAADAQTDILKVQGKLKDDLTINVNLTND